MKNFLALILFLISATALATQSAFNLSPSIDKTLTGQPMLRLRIQDAQPKSGVCPYLVQDLRYFPPVHELQIEIFQEMCLNDAYGQSAGEVDWTIPGSLLSQGQEIPVTVYLIGGGLTGFGTLVYDQPSQSFRLK